MRSRTAVVAALLVLACVVQAAPDSGSGSGSSADPEDESDEGSDEGSGSDALNIESGSGSDSDACPNGPNGPCSGNGKCLKSEDQGMVCDCNAGYHGDDCGEMDDQFDVYYNRLMAQSKGKVRWMSVTLRRVRRHSTASQPPAPVFALHSPCL